MTEFFLECLEPVTGLFDPARRLFWPQLIAAAALAGVVWWVRVRKGGRTSLAQFLFAKQVWLHPSALLDYRFLFLRAVLAALWLGPAWWSAQKLAVWLSLELSWALGRGPLGDVERAWVIAAFSIGTFVVNDFFRYVAHWASHRVKPLWALHQVHHSAEVLTPFTLNRTHPLEGLMMRAVSTLALGLCGGVCAWLFRGRVSAWEIAGVDALAFTWTALGSNLRHSHVWLSFGRWERLFMSPAQHQVHHSVEARHHDKNFGEALGVWDWMFGTLHVTTAEREVKVFGLPEGERNHGATVGSLLVDPVLAMFGVERTEMDRSPPPLRTLRARGEVAVQHSGMRGARFSPSPRPSPRSAGRGGHQDVGR
jgi:sterol desaturase/sphingolipid hydroxylase (fatty acid hydroxylase superfamily)